MKYKIKTPFLMLSTYGSDWMHYDNPSYDNEQIRRIHDRFKPYKIIEVEVGKHER